MKYELPKKSPWAQALDLLYLKEMESVIGKLTIDWFSEEDCAQGYDSYIRACYVYGRMDQCMTSVMPWLTAALPNLAEMEVLEVGCGNGSSTAPLALHAKHVHAFDIDQPSLEVSRRRCELLCIPNIDFFYRDPSWIDGYLNDPRSLVTIRPDVIYCYAFLEHLTPKERIQFLRAAWNDLDVGGHLIIIECPNRLHWFDWHSSMLPFADWLPDDIALLWYGHSERSGIWPNLRARNVEDLARVDKDQLYRFGRGASFHEFVLAIGLDHMRITAGPHSPNAIYRGNLPGYDAEWESALTQKLAALTPPIPPEFAANCLDLIVTKTN